nr:putative niFe hydrogenase-like protein [Tanacetum cinerariifolium]
MGRQWSAGKLVLILDAVHCNPEAPPRTLSRVCLRCDGSFSPQINEEGRSHLILPKNRKRSAMPGRGDGKRNSFEERNWGSQCFSMLNEMRQPRDALLLTPQGSETELNLTGSKSRPPMLNKENYVPWSSRLLWTVNGFSSGLWARQNRMSSPGWSTVRQNRHRLGAIDGTCEGRAVGYVTCTELVADWAFDLIKAEKLAFLLSKSKSWSNRSGPCPGMSKVSLRLENEHVLGLS